MCLGVPMKVIEVDGLSAICEGAHGREQVSLALTGPIEAGGHALIYLGSAVRELDQSEARQISDALEAVNLAARGERFEHLLHDLVDREPALPPHLQEQQSRMATNRENADGPGDN